MFDLDLKIIVFGITFIVTSILPYRSSFSFKLAQVAQNIYFVLVDFLVQTEWFVKNEISLFVMKRSYELYRYCLWDFFLKTKQFTTNDVCNYLFFQKCRKVTGDDKVDPDWLVDIVRGDDYSILVVTPAMIINYFEVCPEASLSDFTLLIFDEYHHAKQDHYYNRLVLSCMQFHHNAAPGAKAPQVATTLPNKNVHQFSNLNVIRYQIGYRYGYFVNQKSAK